MSRLPNDVRTHFIKSEGKEKGHSKNILLLKTTENDKLQKML